MLFFRENSSKFDRNSVQINTSSPAPIQQLQKLLDTERSNYIETSETAEEIGIDRTVTDKSTDIQDSTKDAK